MLLAPTANHRDIAWFDDFARQVAGSTVVFFAQPTVWKAVLVSLRSYRHKEGS
jgi:hypothetical protein